MRLRHATARALAMATVLTASAAGAVGISIDAGLTPAEGRWMVRTQVRSMSREAPDGRVGGMDRVMVPLVVVHGLRPDWTLGARQILDFRSMTMMNGMDRDESGLADLYVFAKYRVLRVNTRAYTLGVAPVIGLAPPTGSDGISSEAWGLTAGLLVSARSGRWGADVNVVYGARGIAGVADADPEPGDERGVDLAVARQIPLGRSGRTAVAPVLEVSYRDIASDSIEGADVADTGRSFLSVAPGVKFTRGDLILEGLVRFPVSQDQAGVQFEDRPMYLLGVRWMM